MPRASGAQAATALGCGRCRHAEPNPGSASALEGSGLEPHCRSFVSEILTVAVRHGLTLGELALLLKDERHPDLHLTLLPCRGWERGMWWDDTGLPWVAPPPDMPAIVTGHCLAPLLGVQREKAS